MTHASVPEDQRKALGITETLIRLSVGLEEVEDLVGDLKNALKAANERNITNGHALWMTTEYNQL